MKALKPSTKMKAVERAQRLGALLEKYNISFEQYELPFAHYGYSLRYGSLRQLIIYDHFISDASEFEAIGYGVINRTVERSLIQPEEI